MTNIQNEAQLEELLIEKLSTGEITPFSSNMDFDFNTVFRSKLWEYRADLKTTAQLEQNFKEILERNNQDVLEKPLSELEFQQVMAQINALTTPYKAGKFLYGYNGVSQIEVDLEDGRHVFLTVFDQSQVGAGNTVYQVVNQIKCPTLQSGQENRRYDVTLLINGLPIYQIELKGPGITPDEALNQMHQYIRENQFSGIFSTVQILMAMTPDQTKYMARTPYEDFNKDFAFQWKNQANENIYRWEDIADQFLTIPAAHYLATNFMILDGSKNKEAIKVMRPYQVFATKLALNKIKHTDFGFGVEKEGYVWHTTGSGKTITSYKTATLASKLPNVDKVVFLVDRKSLTRQTLESYRAYDPEGTSADEINTYSSIEDTSNTTQLKRKLRSKGSEIIITSTQKLQRLVNQENFKAPDKNILFIVDEAHRSTSSTTFKNIQQAFPQSAWMGYSGTPVFEEELEKEIKSKKRTTNEVFGPLIHSYTIRDAIKDKSVLPFKVEFNTTVPDETRVEQLTNYYKELKPEWSEKQIQEKIGQLTPEDMDDSLRGSFYDNNPKHVEAVVKDILANWENRSNNGKYNALLTTHVGGGKASIPMAMQYYREFKKQNVLRKEAGLSPLKVAISVSRDDSNGNTMVETNEGLEEAMGDYGEMFGSPYGLDMVDEYNSDLENRLSKKVDDGKYLDLVIVVDRLLTGFDAPQLNTLYVDRTLKGAALIQAYSRTNRIHNMRDKPFGNIVNYRWPEYSEKLMNEALATYSNPDKALLSLEKQREENEKEDLIVLPYSKQIEKTKDLLEEIKRLTYDCEMVPTNGEKQDQLLQALRQYNGQLAKLKQYPPKMQDGKRVEGFDYNDKDGLFQDLGIDEATNNLITITLGNELKKAISERKHIPVQLIDLRVEHIKDVHIDFDFLTSLMEDLMNQIHDEQFEEAKKTKAKIEEFSNSLEDRQQAKKINQASQAIYRGDYPTADSGLTYPYKLDNNQDLVDKILQAHAVFEDREMVRFQKKWGLQKIADTGFLRMLFSSHQWGKNDLDKAIIDQIIRKASETYKQESEDEMVCKLSKLKFRNQLREAFTLEADKLKSLE